jgi:hypothetical protein
VRLLRLGYIALLKSHADPSTFRVAMTRRRSTTSPGTPVRPEVSKQSPATLAGKAPKQVDQESDPAARRETLELVRAYYGIGDVAVRKRLTNLIREITEED